MYYCSTDTCLKTVHYLLVFWTVLVLRHPIINTPTVRNLLQYAFCRIVLICIVFRCPYYLLLVIPLELLSSVSQSVVTKRGVMVLPPWEASDNHV